MIQEPQKPELTPLDDFFALQKILHEQGNFDRNQAGMIAATLMLENQVAEVAAALKGPIGATPTAPHPTDSAPH